MTRAHLLEHLYNYGLHQCIKEPHSQGCSDGLTHLDNSSIGSDSYRINDRQISVLQRNALGPDQDCISRKTLHGTTHVDDESGR